MEDFVKLFETAPLPYTYVNVPLPDEEDNKSEYNLTYYVNKVITNLTRAGFKHAGFIPTTSTNWNASWGRQYQAADYEKCKCWQKINHFAGAFLMGRKDNLNRRMNELASRGEGLADFYPKSYLLPEDQAALDEAWDKTTLWIVKPSASSRGRGIHLVSSKEEDPPSDPGIVQTYIDRPMLITKRKFDIRLYALIPSCDPLRIYMHRTGLARFCTHEYDPNGDPTDAHMHLTNFSLNKDDKGFKRCDTGEESIEDSKWSFPFFQKHLKENGYDLDDIMDKLEHVTISTVIAGMMAIRKHHQKLIPHRHTSYEMYGIDIMFDEDLKPHLIEINISPSMSGLDSKLDADIKYPLQLDLLRMARIIECDPKYEHPCPGVEMIDELWRETATQERIEAVKNGENGWEHPNFGDYTMLRDFIEEQPRLGGFRRVFPKRDNLDRYVPCFDELTYRDVMFQSWIRMSDADREKAVKTHFDEYAQKMKEICDDAKRYHLK